MDTKQCFKCGETKPLDDFYVHRKMSDGHVNKCKECNKRDVQQNYDKNRAYFQEYDRHRNTLPQRKEAATLRAKWRQEHEPERVREYQRRTRKRHAEARKAEQRRIRADFPTKYQARNAVSNALRKGTLIRQPCAQCGDMKSHGHHEDYTKPLDVVWLCPLHHKARHKELEGRGIEIPF